MPRGTQKTQTQTQSQTQSQNNQDVPLNWKEEILKKTKDLVENFNIDIEGCLSTYLNNLENQALGLNDSALSVDAETLDQIQAVAEINFSEAAAIVSNSAYIFSRKVDYFEIFLKKTMAVFKAEQKGKKIKNKDLEDAATDETGQQDNRDDDEIDEEHRQQLACNT